MMDSREFENDEDFYEFVRAMSAHLEDLGFSEACGELSMLLNAAWTTSSELFRELGLACNKILEREGKRLPPCLATGIKRCKTVCKSAFS
jgi:hypothetical protein